MGVRVLPSSVAGVSLYGPDAPEFEDRLISILGRAPRVLLQPALPYSVIVENNSTRAIALLGVRFDMTGQRAKQSSVVHYMDTLRNPENADLRPGSRRFVCAEPAYTSLVIRDEVAADTRGRMNLDNLRRMLQIRAALDCVAFDDGEFAGPDLLNAFARLAGERETERRLISDVLAIEGERAREALLTEAIQDPDDRVRRTVARKLLDGDTLTLARNFRHRMALWRAET